MPELDRLVRRLFRLDHRRPGPREAAEWEIEHYLAERTERLVKAGWDPEQALREAERRFGPVDRYRTRLERIERRRMRMKWIGTHLETVADGLRDAVRTARRSPAFTAGVIVTLGLGIGANAAMFGIVDRLLLRPPDHVVDADRVRFVGLTRTSERRGTWTTHALTYPDLLDLREAGGFEVAGYTVRLDVTLGSGPEATSIHARLVSHEYFGLLGAPVAPGRSFSPDDDRIGAPGTVVLSREFWRRRFGEDRSVLGRSLLIGGHGYTVIGVAPEGFTGATLEPVDVWLPLETANARIEGTDLWIGNRHWWWLNAVARISDETALEAAEEEATALHLGGRAELIEAERYSPNARIDLMPLMAADEEPEGKVAGWLMGVASLVLLIACANVANLLLARAARRRKEVAVRLAMGAPAGRLAAQRTVEGLALALAGGVVALAIASWGGRALAGVLLPDVLFPSAVTLRVVAFTAAVTVAAGALAGLGPALQSTRRGMAAALASDSRGASEKSSGLRGGLALAQAALSVVLLVGAGLFVQSLRQVESLNLGLDADRVALARLEFTSVDLTNLETADLYRRAAERARLVPGVQAASAVSVPFQWSFVEPLRIPGMDSIPRMPGGGPYYYPVDGSYFRTVGLRVVQGRGIRESDVSGARSVAVVNRTLADSLFQGDAVGGCLLVGREPEGCTTVVGVAEDAARGGIEEESSFAYYLPLDPEDAPVRGLYVRTEGESRERTAEIALALRSFSPQVRFARVDGLRDILDPQARSWRLGATMFSVFGLLALVVSAVGLYSILSFDVAERTRELGIRSALGAAKRRLLARVVVRGMRLVAGGVVLGLAVSWLAAPAVEDLLYGVSPRDSGVLGTVAGSLMVVAVLSSVVPGWRATRVDPMEALRAE